jgi:hypothetical protein
MTELINQAQPRRRAAALFPGKAHIGKLYCSIF